MNQYIDALTTVGYNVNRVDFRLLSEAAQLRVTDEALTGMMKFITDKYNSLDFSEIEKSAGDITKLKYYTMLRENCEMLNNIYLTTSDPGAKKYTEVIQAVTDTLDHLTVNRNAYTTLYKSGNGMVQLMYTSLVAGCLFAVGTLVSNTIRFVTTEKDTECEVLFDEIPGTIKHIHIKNILAVQKDRNSFERVLNTFANPGMNNKVVNESISGTVAVGAILGVAGMVILIPRVIMLIREIIYSIYYSRIKVSDMLGVQAELIRTNIESLEQGRGNKKVIARQKKIAQKLETWKNRIALKMDTTEAAKRTQERKENASLQLDRNSPLIQNSDEIYSPSLMI